MTQTEKALQLIDLCARLPYNTKIAYCTPDNTEVVTLSLATIKIIEAIPIYTDCPISVKPYLRPMSSMTEEEMDKIEKILGDKCIFDFMGNGDVSLHQGNFTQNMLSKLYDFYNSIHVDYRGLIELGLALKAPEGMYNIKKK